MTQERKIYINYQPGLIDWLVLNIGNRNFDSWIPAGPFIDHKNVSVFSFKKVDDELLFVLTWSPYIIKQE